MEFHEHHIVKALEFHEEYIMKALNLGFCML